MEQKDKIEIPFGAFDSELGGFEYTIPECLEAEVKDGKVIFRKSESEDEKIINNIKKVIGWYRGMFTEKSLMPEEYQEINAWLEKQGEQKHTAEEVLIKAGLKPYKDGDQWCVLLGDNIQEGICGFGNTIEDALYAFLKDLIASQGEQKPVEWSEEDENGLGEALWCCEQAASIAKDENDMGNAWYAKRWLKSLKDRCIPQSKQEWSEEDRQMKMKVLKYLSTRCNVFEYEEVECWLKSIRPQSRWKPSDEQMEALYEETQKSDRIRDVRIVSLYNDLKKLKAL